MGSVVPGLDALCGGWTPAVGLAHLPSLRNQWGQAHVNADLASLAWLAIPPFSGGYRTGTLRVDGQVVAAEAYLWRPWGVRRTGSAGAVAVVSDTRLAFEHPAVLWEVTLANRSEAAVAATVEWELLAPVARYETGWGWLYSTPWNDGDGHDFFATERLRAAVLADPLGQPQFPPGEPRTVRLGRPRVPGVQRDEDGAAMLIESVMPDHTAPDWAWPRPPAAAAEIAWVAVGDRRWDGPWRLGGEAERALGAAVWAVGDSVSLRARLVDDADGALLTHGNHPDSLQLLVEGGRLQLRCGGERIMTRHRPAVGEWHEYAARRERDGVTLLVDGETVGRTAPWWEGRRWSAGRAGSGVVAVADSATPARAAFAFAPPPDSVTVAGQRGLATWRVDLAPGAAVRLGVWLEIGDDADVAGRAQAAAAAFGERRDAVRAAWERLWANAFTPGNPDHSGYLPTLVTDDADLATTYYLALAELLYLRHTGGSAIQPVFLTGGPRLGPTATFYWDFAEFARLAVLLEPAGTRAWLQAALATDYDHAFAFDTRHLLPLGNHYAANDYALFEAVERYVTLTGDWAFLDAPAGGRTVADHLAAMATRPRGLRAAFAGGTLADFGPDPWELLECVPNYRHVVASFNAAYAALARRCAALLLRRGDPVAATRLRAEGNALAAAVLGAYAGAGRWHVYHPDHTDTIGHALDFEQVAAHLAADVPPAVAAAMVDFATTRLLDGDWMRALDPLDPIAPYSDRPDHGAVGAFGADPGNTAIGLCRLGRPDLAAALLGRLHRARSGGLWGQAQESLGGGRYTVAERGSSNRDSACAAAGAEAVLAGLFGIDPDFTTPVAGSVTSEWGILRHVRAVGFDLGE
jgi:hypothetical protein